jgi:hypothetical protein
MELEKALDRWSDELQREMYRKALPVQQKMLVDSPELLVVCFRLRRPLNECETLYDLNNLASVWMCIENILLAMVVEGLYGSPVYHVRRLFSRSCWVFLMVTMWRPSFQ